MEYRYQVIHSTQHIDRSYVWDYKMGMAVAKSVAYDVVSLKLLVEFANLGVETMHKKIETQLEGK